MVTINQTDSDNGILLQQRPPRIVAPIPCRPIPINDFLREEGGEVFTEEASPVIPERRPPTPPQRHMPVIILTPTGSPNTAPYAPRTPSPSTYAQYANDNWGHNVGHDTRPIAPTTSYDPWAYRDTTTTPSAAIAPDKFWDNVDIPYSAYFPSDRRSPDHRTPPPSSYRNTGLWNQPIQNRELTPEPVPAIEEPVTSSSTAHLHPPRYSYWQNVKNQHSQASHHPPRATAWERLAR